jgi:hypothetical protein
LRIGQSGRLRAFALSRNHSRKALAEQQHPKMKGSKHFLDHTGTEEGKLGAQVTIRAVWTI